MSSRYPAQIDTSITLPTVVDNFSPVTGGSVNQLRDAILNVETELGVKPSGIYGTVKARFNQIDAALAAFASGITFAGDLSGTISSQTVIGIRGRSLFDVAPDDGYVLTWSAVDNAWKPGVGGGGGGAPSGPAGGDLSGTYPNPQIATGVIINADVNASAAIAYSKLNLATSILNADVNASAAIAYSKLNLAASIVNADVNASAAIVGSKISPDFGSQNVLTTGTISIGSTPATAGTIRLTDNSSIQARNTANSNNIPVIAHSNGTITIGDATLATRIFHLTANDIINRTATHYFQPANGSVDWVKIDSSGVNTNALSILMGTTPSTTGLIRIPNAITGAIIGMRNVGNTNNLHLIGTNSNSNLYLGTDPSFTVANQVSNISMYCTSGGTVAMGIGSSTYLYLNATSTAIEHWKPITGSNSAAVPLVFGSGTITFASANITMTSAQYCFRNLILTGTTAGPRDLVGPTTVDGEFVIRNTTADIITIKKTAGTGVPIAAGRTATVRYDSATADYVRVSSDSFQDNLDFPFAAVSPIIKQLDDATNSVTGDALTIQAQNATGTTSTGGALTLKSGTGTTVDGSINIQTGATARLTISPTLTTITLPTVSFAAAVVTPKINQIDDTTNSIAGDAFTVQAQNATGTTTVGGALILTSGTGTTSDGAVRMQSGGDTMVEAVEIAAGRRVVSLARTSALTTTQMPASTGDGIIYVGNAQTVPSASPVSGQILWSDSTDQIIKSYTTAGNIFALSGDDPELNGLRLTLTTSLPITSSDVSNATTIFLTPFKSGQISLYTGTHWVRRTTAEISLALGTLSANTNYDVFAFWNGSAVVLELSAGWADAVTRTDGLTRVDGVFCKFGATTRRHIGTLRMASTTQTHDRVLNRFLWNRYNAVPRSLAVADPTDTWTYASFTYQQANANAANCFEYVCGDTTLLDVLVVGIASGSTNGLVATVGVGIDSTTTNSALTFGTTVTSVAATTTTATYKGYPTTGYHKINWIEAAGTTITFFGDGSSPTLVKCGMVGEILG